MRSLCRAPRAVHKTALRRMGTSLGLPKRKLLEGPSAGGVHLRIRGRSSARGLGGAAALEGVAKRPIWTAERARRAPTQIEISTTGNATGPPSSIPKVLRVSCRFDSWLGNIGYHRGPHGIAASSEHPQVNSRMFPRGGRRMLALAKSAVQIRRKFLQDVSGHVDAELNCEFSNRV